VPMQFFYEADNTPEEKIGKGPLSWGSSMRALRL